MAEENAYLELFRAGLAFVGGTFSGILTNINAKRLEEKGERKKRKKRSSNVELNESEKLNGEVSLDIERASGLIQNHINDIERWAQVVQFSDLDKKKTLGSVYIQLDTYLIPANRHINKSERANTIPLEKAVLDGQDHSVILGHPGAGKSTSLKKVCDLLINEKTNTEHTFPILLRLRELGELNSAKPIQDHISRILPLEFEFFGGLNSNFNSGSEEAKEEALFNFLNFVKPILILDGFDELRDNRTKGIVLAELRHLARRLDKAKILISCRTGEFNYELEHSNTYEIAPLNPDQIVLFVNRWLKDKEKAKDFLFKVENSPFADTSIKPLSLAHLCAIYQRIGNIPDQPKTIYRKVVNLLIEEWDEQRSIVRESVFEGFQSDKKFEFLSHLSFYLTTTYQTSTFGKVQFETAYVEICEDHGLPIAKASDLVKELESHTGLFLESGYERYEFVHKSIQEYLASEYLVRLPTFNTVRKDFEKLGAELAIAVSISSNSSIYYVELILNYFLSLTLSDAFYNTFVSRLVSENPSFNQNKLVSAATLALVSNWINPEKKNFNKADYSDFNPDLVSTFKALSKGLKLREQKIKIDEYYKFSGGVHDGELVELIRIKKPKDHKRLPSKVFLPIEFYHEFNT
jgi:predicted NACHT family NTPase